MCALCLAVTVARASKIEFFEGSYAEARDEASKKGKPLVVAFMASWSSSCQRMHQLVFTNDDLAGHANSKYVCVLVDVDAFEGTLLKDRFGVVDIPTFLRFDKNGSLVDKENGDMTVDQLRLWLSDPDKLAPPKVVTPRTSSKSDVVTHTPERTPKPAPPASVPPPVKPSAGAVHDVDIAEPDAELILEKEGKEITSRVEKWDVREVRASGYSLQLGVFSTLDNAVRAIQQFEAQADESLAVLLYLVEDDGKTHYKLLTGLYPQREQAERQRERLQNFGVQSFIRSIAEL